MERQRTLFPFHPYISATSEMPLIPLDERAGFMKENPSERRRDERSWAVQAGLDPIEVCRFLQPSNFLGFESGSIAVAWSGGDLAHFQYITESEIPWHLQMSVPMIFQTLIPLPPSPFPSEWFNFKLKGNTTV